MGNHYDFEVSSLLANISGRLVKSVGDLLEVQFGMRLEHLGYDYRNKWLTGNTRDDGTNCGFGGCLYTRPADRDDSYTDIGGMFGFNFRMSGTTELWAGDRVGISRAAGHGALPASARTAGRRPFQRTPQLIGSRRTQADPSRAIGDIGLRGALQELDFPRCAGHERE